MSGYTPVFSSIFQGTLCGRWPDTGVWLCLLALADKHGHVDMTVSYISAITGVPAEMLSECITRFMAEDPQSRTQEQEGRRLRSIDAGRGWGWVIVNHAKYREKARLQSKDSRRTDAGEDAERKRLDRTSPDVPRCPPMSPPHTHTQTQTHTQTHTQKDSDARVSEADQHNGFETLKAAYPKFAGRQDWIQAEMCCRNRLDDGETWLTLMAAVERFAAYCRAIGREGTNFVMSPGKFFSAADEPWKQPWDLPAKINGGKSISQMIDEACDRE